MFPVALLIAKFSPASEPSLYVTFPGPARARATNDPKERETRR